MSTYKYKQKILEYAQQEKNAGNDIFTRNGLKRYMNDELDRGNLNNLLKEVVDDGYIKRNNPTSSDDNIYFFLVQGAIFLENGGYLEYERQLLERNKQIIEDENLDRESKKHGIKANKNQIKVNYLNFILALAALMASLYAIFK